MSDFNSKVIIEMFEKNCNLRSENEALKQHIKRLEAAGDALKTSGYFGGCGDAVNKWVKVKETKP